MGIVGRKYEVNLLEISCKSEKAELIAVYGRRRVGKTFLIRQYFGDKFDFYMTGIYNGTRKEQLTYFNKQINSYANGCYPMVDNWFDAFDQLKHYLSRIKRKNIFVFFDEMPWMDTQNSRFLKAFELFWNSWGCNCPQLKLIICGSATTWMTDKVLGNKGGLHGRVTRSIYLAPFTLLETEQLLASQGIKWTRHQTMDCYMVFGGIPYYISLLQKNLSVVQNVDALFFAQAAQLKEEYDFLFHSLFEQADIYQSVVELLAKKSKGLTRLEIINALHLSDNGSTTTIINNLCRCDFIRRYSAFGKVERNVLYQLTDLFTLFYLKFVKGYNGQDEHRWSNMLESPTQRTWSGYAFEQVCLLHIPQIKKALGINGIQSDVSSWMSADPANGGQIDMVIDRKDQTINLCEMKYASIEFEINKSYDRQIQQRRELFRKQTQTRKALHLTFVTPFGLARNKYYSEVQSEVTMEELFQ